MVVVVICPRQWVEVWFRDGVGGWVLLPSYVNDPYLYFEGGGGGGGVIVLISTSVVVFVFVLLLLLF